MVMVIVVSSTVAVVNVLAPVLLVQRQLTRLRLVGVVISVILWVHHQWPVQVGFHITASFPWVRCLSQGSGVAEVITKLYANISYFLMGLLLRLGGS